MSATELAAVIVVMASVVVVVLLALALASIQSTLREVREAVELLRAETAPLLDELDRVARDANAEMERVDVVLRRADSISGAVDGASRLAYLAFSNPVIKTISIASGTGQALRALRRKRAD